MKTKTSHKKFNKKALFYSSIKDGLFKAVSFFLMIGLNLFVTIPFEKKVAEAFFYDYETTFQNFFGTNILDFEIDKYSYDGLVGAEAGGHKDLFIMIEPKEESMPMQYFVKASTTDEMCEKFSLTVKHGDEDVYQGAVSDFTTSSVKTFDLWHFSFSLPHKPELTHGDLCKSKLIFHAWREEVADAEESGFFSEKIVSLDLRAKTIVLNEVLANPDPNHPYPANREFIELKNNGNASVEVFGWQVSEMTASNNEVKRSIVGGGGSASANMLALDGTVIPAGGHLVLVFIGDSPFLNNTSDTVRLYDGEGTLLDTYSYPKTIQGKSDARIPDGVGVWIDPVPTPGRANLADDEIAIEILLGLREKAPIDDEFGEEHEFIEEIEEDEKIAPAISFGETISKKNNGDDGLKLEEGDEDIEDTEGKEVLEELEESEELVDELNKDEELSEKVVELEERSGEKENIEQAEDENMKLEDVVVSTREEDEIDNKNNANE